MRFGSYINNQRCLEWGLNANQGALFDLLNQASSWANEVVIDGVVYYWVSRNEVIKELPLFYAKADTVYRHFVALNEKGLIEYLKFDGKDLIRLTAKGKTWNEFNSEINPNFCPKLGLKSEKTRIEIRKSSDLDPTNNNTNNKYTSDHNINTSRQVATSRKPVKFSENDLTTAKWIFGLLQKMNPSIRPINFESWANEVRLMREVDKRSHKEICELFKFANQHDFWSTNILSPKNLRKHWVRLTLEQAKPKKKTWSEINNSDWNTREAWEEMI